MKTATIKLKSLTPMTQSRMHDERRLEKELPGAYEERTWQSKAHVDPDGFLLIPAFALKMSITDAAKYSSEQIPGKGKATWTKKFMAGILIPEDIRTNKRLTDCQRLTINANVDGVRGSGKRVIKHFPRLADWEAKSKVLILDDIITKDIFTKFVKLAGELVGVGQYRPQVGGTNGRFSAEILDWTEV